MRLATSGPQQVRAVSAIRKPHRLESLNQNESLSVIRNKTFI